MATSETLTGGSTSNAPRLALVLLALVVGAVAGASADATYLAARQVTGSTATAQNSTGSDSASSSSSSAFSGTLDAASIARNVDPAVVDITTTLANQGGQAAGTGMVITSSGEVLTNNHVIAGASRISVQIAGSGPTYSAKVLGTDKTDDIALLQIQGVSKLRTVSVGDSSRVVAGAAVLAIGNALGQGGTPAVSQGVVTALDQTITAGDGSGTTETLSGLLQIRALIQPGDSGGPLVDASGKVIGMDAAAQVSGRFAQTSGSTNAYAIPINAAMSVVKMIRAGGGGSPNIHVGDRALLGVSVQDGSSSGALVVGVQSGSPAESAGLAAGDAIISVGGANVTSAGTLTVAMQAHHPGDRVAVSWLDAAGSQHDATITLIAGPPA
jgi:S1-C subfamily serine protease